MTSNIAASKRRELIASEASAFAVLPPAQAPRGTNTLSKRTRHNRLFAMSQDLVSTYKICNPKFRGLEVLPQRVLTVPSEGVHNNGMDNEDSNLICKVHDTFKMDGYVFTILDLLGTGTFGQVFRCIRSDTKDIVAVKVVKNKPAYQAQGLLEIKVARLLNEVHDPNDERHIVRLLDSFEHHGHVCLVFELLSLSLLDVLTQNQFRGLPLVVVQRFTRQILTALVALEEADVIHCDLKPENILLVPSAPSNPPSPVNSSNSSPTKAKNPADSAEEGSTTAESSELNAASGGSPGKTSTKTSSKLSDVKVIDFGSACFEGKTVYSYIQSRFYRSPEVLLGLPYNGAIDMWSLACVCAEMFLGLPLFPGVSQHNQLFRIVEMLGLPPDFLIEGKNGRKYFATVEKNASAEEVGKSPQSVTVGSAGITSSPSAPATEGEPKYRIKTAEEYAAETNTQVPVLRKYLRYNRLDEVIMRCPLAQKSRMTQEQKTIETIRRHCFLDFLQGLFRLNPFERWTARQAFSHPFIQNTKFSGPYVPPLDMKTNERKLDFMVLTQRKPPPSSFDAPTLSGAVRAPSNFSNTTGSSAQFTPLLLAHRRMSDPGLDHSAKGILQGGGPQLLKRGSPAHLKVENPVSPPAPEHPTSAESAVPFSSPHTTPREISSVSVDAAQAAATESPLRLQPPQMSGSANRARSGSSSSNHNSPVTTPRQLNNSGSAAQGIMRVNSKGNFQQMVQQQQQQQQPSPQQQSQQQPSLPAPPPQLSQSFSPQVQTQRFMQQHQQQILHQQQQAYMMQRGNPYRGPQSASQGQVLQGQMQQQQSQQGYSQQQQQLMQQAHYDGSSSSYHAGGGGHYPAGRPNLPYNMASMNPQLSSSMSMHMSGGAMAMSGTSLGNSYSAYGTVGSMQDGSSVVMTDFGLALMRPDMDENRRLQSQQSMHPGYWQHPHQHGPGGAVYGSPVAQSSPFAYANQYANQGDYGAQHGHQTQPQMASSYAFAPNMAQLASNYANAGYNPSSQQQAGSYDSKTMLARGRRNQHHVHEQSHQSQQSQQGQSGSPKGGNSSNNNNGNIHNFNSNSNSRVSNGGANASTKINASSPQQSFFKSDTGEANLNQNNLKRLSSRQGQKESDSRRGSEHSMVPVGLLPSNPDIRRPSPAYHKDERGAHYAPHSGGASSNIIKISADAGQRSEPASTVVAGSYVESPNRTSFHMLRHKDANHQGTSFIEREMERRDSFIPPKPAAAQGPQSANTSQSNSTSNSTTNSRQNSADSTSSSSTRLMFASIAEQMAAAGGTPNMRTAGFAQSQNTGSGDARTKGASGQAARAGQVAGGRRRDPGDRRGGSNTSNVTEGDVLEEWDPFFEADDLSGNT